MMPRIEINRGRVDGEMVKQCAQRLAWPVTEHLGRDHEHLAAVEVTEKGPELEAVPAWPEITLSDRGGPAGAVEERFIPATPARPVVLVYEEVRLAEHPAARKTDVGMVVELVAKTHGPCLHRPDHHEDGHGGTRMVSRAGMRRGMRVTPVASANPRVRCAR